MEVPLWAPNEMEEMVEAFSNSKSSQFLAPNILRDVRPLPNNPILLNSKKKNENN
jgi:hypothetical protein